MAKLRFPLLLLFSLTVFLSSCKEEKEILELEALPDYLPLTVGKYITYRVDSLIYTNFGRSSETRQYLMKHVIESQITDAAGRPSYRVFRYLNTDITGATNNWLQNGSYFITPLTNQIEVIEDNLRMIKLRSPLRSGFSWKGNAYLPDEPYDKLDPQNNYDEGMRNWEYVYTGFEPSVSIEGESYSDVWSVVSADVAINVPIVNNNQLSLKRKCEEKFAKGIGLVFRQHELWERQPNQGGSGGPYYIGFGITMWMVAHN